MTEKLKLWGEDGAELLTNFTANEAIEEILDGFFPDPLNSVGHITVYEYEPMVVSETFLNPLENMLEMLDEEYGDPNDNGTEPTEAMKKAESVFVKAILSEYTPGMCEQTGESVTVDALEWAKEHRPDWLKERPVKTGDYVDIKQAVGGGNWKWSVDKVVRRGHVVDSDKHCLTVRTDDGETIRDVREHFREATNG